MTQQKLSHQPHAAEPTVDQIKQDIEHTRAEMSATLEALETKLNPHDLREKVGAELSHVEERVREVVREQIGEAKVLLHDELLEAKGILRDGMDEAEAKIKRGLGEAKDAVKKDVAEAIGTAKKDVRAATLGRVETFATNVGDAMNDTRDTLIDTIKNNPIPAALAGVGIAWLLMSRSSNARRMRERELEGDRAQFSPQQRGGAPTGAQLLEGAQHAVGDVASRVGHTATDTAHRVAEAAGAVVHQVTDAAGNLVHGAQDLAGNAAHGVTGMAHDASELATRAAATTANAASSFAHGARDAGSQLAHRAGDAASYVAGGAKTGARRVEHGFHDTLEHNPMLLGAAALAVGAAVGLSLPRTQREDALMGDVRDKLVHQAQELTGQAVGSVAQLAEKTAGEAKRALEMGTRHS